MYLFHFSEYVWLQNKFELLYHKKYIYFYVLVTYIIINAVHQYTSNEILVISFTCLVVVQLFLMSDLCSSCDPMNYSTPGFPVLHYIPEFVQIHIHWINNAIQLSHPLSPPFLPALNLSQHQSLFQWVDSLHQVAKVLKLQLQYQSFQRIFRVYFL